MSQRFRLSQGIKNTGRPPIPRAYAWAALYPATEARPLLDMSQGVPGVPPPNMLLDAMAAASAAPSSCGYLANAGDPALLQAMAKEMKECYGEDADILADDLVITAGCNLAFSSPQWSLRMRETRSSFPFLAVLLHTYANEGFLPSPERCASLITSKTKAIVLVTPNNPTGAIYPPNLLASFASLAREHNLALVLDETYRDFVSSGAPHHLFSPSSVGDAPLDWAWRTTLVHLFSFSKSFCIPGHRLGLVAGPPAFTAALCTALDSLQICAPRAPQAALAPLITSGALRPFVQDMARAVQHRHALFKARVPPRWRIGCQGGYYAFVRHPFVGRRAEEICERLAREAGVVTLPAGFFAPPADEKEGEEGRWVRFSVANVDDRKVELVCERLAECETTFGWELD
ncbi:PLP-dependent transferase [Epithele typhae]|uniref:PLP-dependent transferase n=1 Tax=Epithele typhae TaxID=378194 RepID=UPI002008A9EF|nr:PLP-dependent transferase [Epithele typhae]KAH9919209.1 PLP-dependent transferase [Epithele typhae]